jgi:hypothetical protein
MSGALKGVSPTGTTTREGSPLANACLTDGVGREREPRACTKEFVRRWKEEWNVCVLSEIDDLGSF